MSAYFQLYVIDEKKFPVVMPSDWSNERRYHALVAIVRQEGASWETIETDPGTLRESLTVIDELIGGTELLPLFAFHCSPDWLLEKSPLGTAFGYYKPEVVQDLFPLLDELEKQLEDSPDDPDLEPLRSDEVDSVLYALASAMREAGQRGHAVAVLHSW